MKVLSSTHVGQVRADKLPSWESLLTVILIYVMEEGIPLIQSYDKKQYVELPREDIYRKDAKSVVVNDIPLQQQQEIELERLEFQIGARSLSNKFHSHGETVSDTETETLVRIKYPPKNKAVALPTTKPFEQTIKSISSVDEFNLHHIALSPTIGLYFRLFPSTRC